MFRTRSLHDTENETREYTYAQWLTPWPQKDRAAGLDESSVVVVGRSFWLARSPGAAPEILVCAAQSPGRCPLSGQRSHRRMPFVRRQKKLIEVQIPRVPVQLQEQQQWHLMSSYAAADVRPRL